MTLTVVHTIDPATQAFLARFLTTPPPAFDVAGAFVALEKAMSDKIDALEASIQKQNDAVAAAVAAESTFADQITALAATNETLKSANDVLQSANTADEAELDKARQTIDSSTAQIDQLVAQLKALGGTPGVVTTEPSTG